MTADDITTAVLNLTGKVGELTATVSGVRREMTDMRTNNALEHGKVIERIGELEELGTRADERADVKRGILRSPYLLQVFTAALAALAVYFGASAKQEASAVQDGAANACQATQDLRNRALTGLVNSLSEGTINKRYFDAAITQLPPKADCS